MIDHQLLIPNASRVSGIGDLRLSLPFPRLCPHCFCGHNLPPVYVAHGLESESHPEKPFDIAAVYQCTGCDRFFYITYHVRSLEDPEPTPEITAQYPDIPTDHFGNAVRKAFPEFVDTYRNACTIQLLLPQDSCMIFRKALEILVKSYAIRLEPQSEEDIRQKPLGACISHYLKDERLQTIARACSWIGNDYAHFLTHLPEYGPDDMRRFIRAVASFIDFSLAVEEAGRYLSRASVQRAQ